MRFLLFFSLLLFCGTVFSQRSKIETITIGLDQKGHAETEWPFDLPFYVAGAIGDDVVAVTFNYRVQDEAKRKKGWISFPKKSLTDSTGYLKIPKGWKRGIGESKQFVMLCDGLHPNVRYDFQFTLTRKVSLDAKLVAEMRTRLAGQLRGFFESMATKEIDATVLRLQNDTLTLIVKSYFPDRNLRMKADTTKPFSFNAFTRTDPANIAQSQTAFLIAALETYTTNKTKVIAGLNNKKLQVNEDIRLLQEGKLKLNGYSKQILAVPFNPGLPEFKAYTLLDGLKLLNQLSQTPSFLDLLLNGKKRISNNGFTDTERGEHHIESILFLSSLLKEISSGAIKDTVGGIEKPRFAYFEQVMKDALIKVEEQLPKIAAAKGILAKIEAMLPDIIATIVQVEAVETEVLPSVDVVSDKTPYISAEAGIVYVQAFRSVAHYRGANIYFTPIDKRAPLKYFRGWMRLWKRLSFQIGVSNFFGDRPVNTFSLLGKTAKTDLDLAFGLRLNRIIKINAGVIPYRTNNLNSINDKMRTRGAGYISIGIDVNLLKAFGDVGTLLSL